MNNKTKIETGVLTSAQAVEDFKHATLILSVSINLTIFVVWILAYAGAGTV